MLSPPAADPVSQVPEAHTRPPYSEVARGLAGIDERGPEQLSSAALRDDLRWFEMQVRALEALKARWLAELDRREQREDGAAGDGEFRRCTAWLSDALKLTPNAAYAQLRTARALDGELRLTAAALRRGEISARHVEVIRRAMEQVDRTCLERSAVESELVLAARQMDPFELERHWKQIRYQADQVAAEEAEEEQRRQSWLSLRRTWWDTYRIEGVRHEAPRCTPRCERSWAARRRTTSGRRCSAGRQPWASWPGPDWTRATCRSGAARSRT